MDFPHVPGSSIGGNNAEIVLQAAASARPNALVLHLGAKRSVESRSTIDIYKYLFLNDATHQGADASPGLDVGHVFDLEELPPHHLTNSFDFVMCCSTLEHVKRPWDVAQNMRLLLKPGGGLFVQTHQTFPIHGYPRDYFRFSREALEVVLQDGGFTDIVTCYDYRCRIVPESGTISNTNWDHTAASFLNVYGFARA